MNEFETLLINGKELKKKDLAIDFLISILDLKNSINVFLYSNFVKNNLDLKLELTHIIKVLTLIHQEFGLEVSKKEYRIDEHKNLLSLVEKYNSKIVNYSPNILSSKEGCLVKECYIKSLRLEHKFYCLNIETLYSPYLNYLVLYFDVLSKIVDKENGF